MAENEWAKLLDTLTEAWNKIAIQLEEFAKAFSDMFTSFDSVETKICRTPRKRQRPPKKINCTYSVKRRTPRNLPYQRRIF